jgi:hypothetical protein
VLQLVTAQNVFLEQHLGVFSYIRKVSSGSRGYGHSVMSLFHTLRFSFFFFNTVLQKLDRKSSSNFGGVCHCTNRVKRIAVLDQSGRYRLLLFILLRVSLVSNFGVT